MDLTTPIPADKLVEARRRAEYLAENGATVIGISQQAAAAGASVFWTLLAAQATRQPGYPIWTLIAAAGAVITVLSWIQAKRLGKLVANSIAGPEQPLQPLTKKQRVSITRQMRGRYEVTSAAAPLVQAMLMWQRKRTRALIPTFIGIGLGLTGLAGSSSNRLGEWSVAFLGLEAAAVAFVAIVAVVEAHRRNRVLTAIETKYGTTPD